MTATTTPTSTAGRRPRLSSEIAWVTREARELAGSTDTARRDRFLARKAALLASIDAAEVTR